MLDRLVPATIRRNFTYDLAASLLIGVFLSSVINFTPVVARRLGANETLLSILVAAPLFGNLVTPLSVYFPARYRFRALIGIWALARGLFLLTLLVSKPVPFIAIVVAYYILVALPMPAYVEVMASVYPVNMRGRAMSYVRAGMTAVLTIVTPMAGWLMDRLGFAAPFALGALAGIASAKALSNLNCGPFSTRRTSIWQVLGVLRQDRMFAIYSAALMFLGTGNLLGLAIFPIVQVDQFHLSYASVGLLSLANSLTWMVSSVALGALLDRKGALPVMLVANIAQALMPICYFMASDVTLVAVAFVLGGVAMAGGDLAWLNVVLLFSGPDRVPDYSALHMLLLGVRGVIGPILGAILLNVVGLGLHETLLVAFAVQIAGSLIMMWVTATYRSPQLGVSTVG